MTRIYTSVEIDVDDVIDEIDTKDLVAELKTRKNFDAVVAADPALQKVLGLLSSWDLERLAAAVVAGDGAKAVTILRPIFCPTHHAPTREAYDALPRDPASGRPVIQ